MRFFFLGNNWTGWQALRWLKAQGAELVGLAVHTPERQKCCEELLAEAGLPAAAVFEAPTLREPAVLARVRALQPDLGLSVLFGHVLRPDFLRLFPQGCLNLHPALLPYNRGAHPNVWSLIEGTPAGVTLHYMDAGVDTGDIVAQRPVPVRPTDTGETLYRRLEQESLALLREAWPRVCAGELSRQPQPAAGGTSHRQKDLEALDRIELDRQYRARDLINLLRARTFPPYDGAYFEVEGRRIYLRLELYEAADPTRAGT